MQLQYELNRIESTRPFRAARGEKVEKQSWFRSCSATRPYTASKACIAGTGSGMESLPQDIRSQIISLVTTDGGEGRGVGAAMQAVRIACRWMRDAFDAGNRRLVLGGRLPFPPWEEGPETSLPGFAAQLPALLARTPNLEELKVR